MVVACAIDNKMSKVARAISRDVCASQPRTELLVDEKQHHIHPRQSRPRTIESRGLFCLFYITSIKSINNQQSSIRIALRLIASHLIPSQYSTARNGCDSSVFRPSPFEALQETAEACKDGHLAVSFLRNIQQRKQQLLLLHHQENAQSLDGSGCLGGLGGGDLIFFRLRAASLGESSVLWQQLGFHGRERTKGRRTRGNGKRCCRLSFQDSPH